jgi:hypothetical protein
MTKTTSDSQITTYDWLLNILKNSLISVAVKIELWQEMRAFAVEVREREIKDRSEYDGWSERINLNDRLVVNTESLRRLKIAVEGNPYPGKQMRVHQVAVEQIPEVGKFRWRLIFEDSDFNFPVNFGSERISFPVRIELTVEDIEKVLFELVREDNTVLASLVPVALSLKPTGKQYKEVKKILLSRGWVWSRQYEEGKQVRVVIAPTQ